jgi:lysine 6-dehydrogenase
MDKKVLILGGGKMGQIIASELSRAYQTKVADINQDICDIRFDISSTDKTEIKKLFNKFDLVVGALPSHLGYKPLCCAAENGSAYVDLSFTADDPAQLHNTAIKNGSMILHDCGLSPGLSNLVAGRLNRIYKPSYITIMVGGISQDPGAPYGHVNTWCPEDLREEYTRPARFILDGKERYINPLDSRFWSKHSFDNIGELEGFISDGLRSLLKLKGPNTVSEITLRRKGHLKKVRKLIGEDKFIKEIKQRCNSGKDAVILQVDCDGATVTMLDIQKDHISSMARTTAYSCAAFAKLILKEKWKHCGVFAPEDISQLSSVSYCDHYQFIINELFKHGIVLKEIKVNNNYRG